MKTLYIEQPKQQKYLYLFMGGLFLFQGIINLFHDTGSLSFWLGIFQVSFSVFCFLYSYSIIKPQSFNNPRIQLGTDSITLFKGNFSGKPVNVSHSDIKMIQLKPERITLMTKAFDFTHSMDYQGTNKAEIIHEIETYAKELNLPFEHISYRNV